jgi:hypothetical protein
MAAHKNLRDAISVVGVVLLTDAIALPWHGVRLYK